ncbi:hypothetical protein QUF79_24425 [Fictibacillus enclensis]|nr:hypothetical protein [Fictibacillus enclensis]MDM5201175.1 hypothetical protein [Fictibacillus enclensis]
MKKGSTAYQIINFFGSAEINMILAVLVAIYVFGLRVR